MKFLDALACKNQNRPPIWLMRQAGRYLPSYQEIRKHYSLSHMFFTPQIAKEITLQPVHQFGLDAAILFSDITVIAKALDLHLDFVDGIGPVVTPRLEKEEEIRAIPVEKALGCVAETIQLLQAALSVPLIGFCGGPFTVAHYLVKKEALFNHRLLQKITDVTLDYLDLQIDAGVNAIQIFDSWSHLYSLEELHLFCFPYHEQLLRKVQSRNIPVISFFRSATSHPQEIAQLRPDGISFDCHKPLFLMRQQIGPTFAIQGNLDPDLLFSPLPIIEKQTLRLLESMDQDPGFIFNLGHGIKPKTPWKAVEHLVKIVQSYGS